MAEKATRAAQTTMMDVGEKFGIMKAADIVMEEAIAASGKGNTLEALHLKAMARLLIEKAK